MSRELHVFFDAEGTLYGPRGGRTSEEFWDSEERTEERAKRFFTLDPDIPQLLRALKDRGHRLYVLSRNVEQVLFPLMFHFGIREYFDEVVIREDKGRYLDQFKQRRRLAADQIVMVGDTPELDIRPVRERGFRAIHLDCSAESQMPDRIGEVRQVLQCLEGP
jgi:FMN phosphatase YigB (HAD superfamily)